MTHLRGKEKEKGVVSLKASGKIELLHVTGVSSYRVRRSPAPVGGQTAGGLQPGTDSSRWTEPGPGGWQVVPGVDTATQQRHHYSNVLRTFITLGRSNVLQRTAKMFNVQI